MGYFEHNGISFYYRTTGKGIPFVFLHGMGGNTRQVEKLFTPPPGIRMVYMDQRGNGNTELGEIKDLQFATLSNDIFELCEYLHLKEIILGGVSMGAAVATRFAIEHAEMVKKLILIRPAWNHFPMDVDIREKYHLIAELIKKYQNPQEAADEYRRWKKFRELKKEAPETAKSLIGHFKEKNIMKNYKKFKVIPEQSPFHNPGELKKILCPTLVLATKNDPIHKYQYGVYYKDYIPNAKLLQIVSKNDDKYLYYRGIQDHIDKFLKSIDNII